MKRTTLNVSLVSLAASMALAIVMTQGGCFYDHRDHEPDHERHDNDRHDEHHDEHHDAGVHIDVGAGR